GDLFFQTLAPADTLDHFVDQATRNEFEPGELRAPHRTPFGSGSDIPGKPEEFGDRGLADDRHRIAVALDIIDLAAPTLDLRGCRAHLLARDRDLDLLGRLKE